uniref:Putative secreted protein n=1 Tax=Anopheles marajoara TaxID=58244 RepID=A0A2M4C9T7_9DIPT
MTISKCLTLKAIIFCRFVRVAPAYGRFKATVFVSWCSNGDCENSSVGVANTSDELVPVPPPSDLQIVSENSCNSNLTSKSINCTTTPSTLSAITGDSNER